MVNFVSAKFSELFAILLRFTFEKKKTKTKTKRQKQKQKQKTKKQKQKKERDRERERRKHYTPRSRANIFICLLDYANKAPITNIKMDCGDQKSF